MEKTFKETVNEGIIEKPIKKSGLSLGIIFSKDELKLFNLKYGDIINLNEAKIIKKQKSENI